MEITERKKIAVISGGLGLLGREIGRQLLDDGLTVVLLDYKKSDQDISDLLISYNTKDAYYYNCDLQDFAGTSKILEEIENKLGPIEIGIHCAQTPILRKKISELDIDTFKTQFSVGVFGGFNFFKVLASLLKIRQKGILIGVTTSAIEEENTTGNFGGYLSSKFALKGLLKELENELKPYNIKVIAIAPGFMAGGLNADLPPRLIELMKERFPDKRLTEPGDVAKIISSICTNKELNNNTTIIIDSIDK